MVTLFGGLNPASRYACAGLSPRDREGSRALRSRPSLPDVAVQVDRYIFIETSQNLCQQLESLKSEFLEKADKIDIRQGDASAEIQRLCAKDWRRHRAVVFLDPLGMQVEWTTIEAIVKTQAIDMWLLFPLGIGVSRLLPRHGQIPEEWQRRLNLILGTENWYEEFYEVRCSSDLFGNQQKTVVKAKTDTIGKYFFKRLGSVFAGVIEEPEVLRNSLNCPLYLLCFAVGNPKGKDIALRIAESLLKEIR